MNNDDQNIKKDQAAEPETEDVVIEDIEEKENPAATLKKLREKLKIAVAEKQQYLDGWQRSKADFINFKKRQEEERKEFIKFSKEEIISDIIPVLDSFDLAFGNKEAWEKADKNWRVGVEYIYSQLVSVLANHGVKQSNPIGEKFNPSLHEPTENISTNKKEEDGVILAVLQKGYELNGKIIRPAKVKVGEFK